MNKTQLSDDAVRGGTGISILTPLGVVLFILLLSSPEKSNTVIPLLCAIAGIAAGIIFAIKGQVLANALIAIPIAATGYYLLPWALPQALSIDSLNLAQDIEGWAIVSVIIYTIFCILMSTIGVFIRIKKLYFITLFLGLFVAIGGCYLAYLIQDLSKWACTGSIAAVNAGLFIVALSMWTGELDKTSK